MRPELPLNADEKLLLEYQPNNVYVIYSFITKFWLLIIGGIIFFIFLNSQAFINMIGVSINSRFQINSQDVSAKLTMIKTVYLFIIFAIFLLGFLWLKYINSCYWYFFTNQRCIYYYEFFGTDRKMVPYNRIFNVEIKQNFLQSCLNLAFVYINTQNISSPNFSSSDFPILKGLSKNAADEISAVISSQLPRN